MMQVHEGRGSLSEHLVEFRRGIFEGLLFSLDGMQHDDLTNELEVEHVAGLKEHLTELISIMGGKITPTRVSATIWIFY